MRRKTLARVYFNVKTIQYKLKRINTDLKFKEPHRLILNFYTIF